MCLKASSLRSCGTFVAVDKMTSLTNRNNQPTTTWLIPTYHDMKTAGGYVMVGCSTVAEKPKETALDETSRSIMGNILLFFNRLRSFDQLIVLQSRLETLFVENPEAKLPRDTLLVFCLNKAVEMKKRAKETQGAARALYIVQEKKFMRKAIGCLVSTKERRRLLLEMPEIKERVGERLERMTFDGIERSLEANLPFDDFCCDLLQPVLKKGITALRIVDYTHSAFTKNNITEVKDETRQVDKSMETEFITPENELWFVEGVDDYTKGTLVRPLKAEHPSEPLIAFEIVSKELDKYKRARTVDPAVCHISLLDLQSSGQLGFNSTLFLLKSTHRDLYKKVQLAATQCATPIGASRVLKSTCYFSDTSEPPSFITQNEIQPKRLLLEATTISESSKETFSISAEESQKMRTSSVLQFNRRMTFLPIWLASQQSNTKMQQLNTPLEPIELQLSAVEDTSLEVCDENHVSEIFEAIALQNFKQQNVTFVSIESAQLSKVENIPSQQYAEEINATECKKCSNDNGLVVEESTQNTQTLANQQPRTAAPPDADVDFFIIFNARRSNSTDLVDANLQLRVVHPRKISQFNATVNVCAGFPKNNNDTTNKKEASD